MRFFDINIELEKEIYDESKKFKKNLEDLRGSEITDKDLISSDIENLDKFVKAVNRLEFYVVSDELQAHIKEYLDKTRLTYSVDQKAYYHERGNKGKNVLLENRIMRYKTNCEYKHVQALFDSWSILGFIWAKEGNEIPKFMTVEYAEKMINTGNLEIYSLNGTDNEIFKVYSLKKEKFWIYKRLFTKIENFEKGYNLAKECNKKQN